MNDTTSAYTPPSSPTPNPALRAFDVLVGTWDLQGRESGPYGEIHGQVRYEWMEGGFFLLQYVDFDHVGHHVKGIEVIGYEQKWGEAAPSKDVVSHFFDSEGNHLEYVYEITDDTLTIWGGYVGSPAYFRGTMSADRNTIVGGWHYPDGGGYESTIKRVPS